MEDLQRWLSIEHEAVWLYGLIGGRFEDDRDVAEASWEHHRDARDHLNATIRAAGEVPVGPALTYGDRAGTAREAKRAARDVERRVSETCVAIAADAEHRRLALTSLRRSARASIRWGARPQAFPGLS